MTEYARLSETVYDWLAWYDYAPFLPHPEVSFISDAPRLDSIDAGTSYVGIETPRDVGFDDLAPIVFFAPATINEDTYAKVQVRSRGASSNLSVTWATVDGILLYQYISVPADEWVTVELQPVAAWAVEDSNVSVYETIRDAAPTEGFAVWVGVDFFTTSPGFDVSYIGVFGGRPIPTRVYPRADGLGMGAPRLMDNRSPYRSPRVFGQI